MIRLDTISTSEPTADQLAALKAYASVVDSSQDALLTSLLKGAMLKVQRMVDCSLLVCTFELVVTEKEDNGPVNLYQTIDLITSVTDASGNNLQYTRVGNQIFFDKQTDTCIIRYSTKVYASDFSQYIPQVWQTAAAMYDGESAQIIHQYLSQR